MNPFTRFFLMLGSLIGLAVALIQALVVATTPGEVIFAATAAAVAVLIGLIATKENF